NWDKLKKEEKKRDSVLDGVPTGSPSLVQAYELQKKASEVGFDWDDIEDVWNKLDEEIKEVYAAIQTGHPRDIENEWGDVLFVLVNLCRHYNINPELALNASNQKFISRFSYIEKALQHAGKDISSMDVFSYIEKALQHAGKDIHTTALEEMERYWNEAKGKELCSMRLDKFLKITRLIKRRTLAKEVADQGRITINGNKAKASSKVNVGDELTIQYGQKYVTVRVNALKEHVKKDEVDTLYEIINEEKR